MITRNNSPAITAFNQTASSGTASSKAMHITSACRNWRYLPQNECECK
ncbi:hypothetical protein B932_0588 [Gluconobacter oxydans H24]|nr:hypothetical protein B932_0588 [Gluconobacter oxydans H24]